MTIAVAGATGSLGRAVVAELLSRGQAVAALGRDGERLAAAAPAATPLVVDAVRAGEDDLAAALRGAGVSAVFSCLGASVMPSTSGLYATYRRVDQAGNLKLLAAAKAADVHDFTYVSVAGAEANRGLQYHDAHEAVVDALRDSGLRYAVVRPTGFFSAFGGLMPYARRGAVPVIGDPGAKTNPISERDLARLCADAVLTSDFGERTVGGPEVLTRGEIAEALFAAVGREGGKLRRVPAWLARFGAAMMWPLAPRMTHIMRFYAWVGTRDCVYEAYGEDRIADYFASLHQAAAAG